ncbi:protein-L-isoaspartate(D-aspartate) O-methyltransferase [Chelativorans composti]|jgi:Protein-L-isoaspartate carboxylmethyltransferase|uniref:Protein-L-isoaspartate O-methyltransferase n=1 Tax=Chelativorans composti TaxID=768533 RepID=A0ABW5DHY9_9HYPH|nr:protein-L-isoaspartate(D-aspartate) O-methyltransferase [bacterium SGD-2]
MNGRVGEREGFAAFMLRMRARGILNNPLFAAMEAIPRGSFVPVEWHNWTWSHRSVPIDCGEVIEGCDLQGVVLDALELGPGHKVLEIGSGSGYTAAVMSRLVSKVVSIDRYKRLIEDARVRHEALGINNIVMRQANGLDAIEDGPFDRIVAWAAFEEHPRRFADLLTSGGILVAPVGPGDGEQMLQKFVKMGSRFERTDLMPVRMQPLAKGLPLAL